MSPTRPARTLALLALAALPLASGCERTAEAERQPHPPAVGVVEARRMDVPEVAEPNATTRALQSVSIRARVRGFLEQVNFKEGADVKEGDLLFVIEEEPFQVALDQAKAQRAQAEASLQKAKDSKAREIAAAQIAVAQALQLLARIEEARQTTLLNRNAASPQDVDRAQAQRKQRDAEVQSAQAEYEQARADYDVNILAAEAQLAEAKAAVREAEIDLGYCRMYSPIDGRIGEAQIKAGNLVGPVSGGADYTELATVQQLDPMGVDIQVSSKHLDRAVQLINEGLTFTLERPGADGEAAHSYPGEVFFLDNKIDSTTSTFLVKGEVPNPRKTLLPGEYVKLGLVVGTLKGVVVLPEQAVMETQGGQMVYTVDKDDKVGIARVVAGPTVDGLRVLEGGLEPGTRVIVEGIQLARPGMPVKPVPADESDLPPKWGRGGGPPPGDAGAPGAPRRDETPAGGDQPAAEGGRP
jgi:RND family efflux transporter MFP subunit